MYITYYLYVIYVYLLTSFIFNLKTEKVKRYEIFRKININQNSQNFFCESSFSHGGATY